MTPCPYAPPTPEPSDLRECAATLRRHWRSALAPLALALGVAGALTAREPETYTAATTLILDAVTPPAEAREILQSRSLAARARVLGERARAVPVTGTRIVSLEVTGSSAVDVAMDANALAAEYLRTTPRASILDEARPPTERAGPRWGPRLGWAGILGLIGGALLAWARAALDHA